MYYINLVDKSREMHQKNGVEAIVDSDGTFCLNEKYIEKGSYHKYLQMAKEKYLSDHRDYRYELVDAPKNNPTEFL